MDFYDRYVDLREYTDSDAEATLTRVPPRDGCLLFVDPDFDRQAVATSMLAATIALTRHRGTVALTTCASLTAKPLFEWHGYVIAEERHFLSRDVELTNVAMRCELGAA